VTVSYNYGLGAAPQWYRDAFFEDLRGRVGLSEDQLLEVAARKNKLYGITLTVPPPNRLDI
jgi:hypothetical protein